MTTVATQHNERPVPVLNKLSETVSTSRPSPLQKSHRICTISRSGPWQSGEKHLLHTGYDNACLTMFYFMHSVVVILWTFPPLLSENFVTVYVCQLFSALVRNE